MGEGEDSGSAGAINGADAMSDAGLGPGFSDPSGMNGMAGWGMNDIADDASFDSSSLGQIAADWGIDADFNGIATPAASMPNVSWSGDSSDTSWLGKMMSHPALQALAFLASKGNPAVGMAMGLGKAMTSNNPASNMLGMLGNVAQGFMGIPSVPGMPSLGQGMAAHGPGITAQGSPGDTSAGNSGSRGDWMTGLAGLYANYQGMRDNQKMLGGLQNLYRQGSPYSQQLRQQLERRDAAGGRRSQYGPREVELQAKLAQMASNQIPAMSQMSQNQAMMRALMLQNGIKLARDMGVPGMLQSMFQPSQPNFDYIPQPGAENFMGPLESNDLYPDYSLPSFMGT